MKKFKSKRKGNDLVMVVGGAIAGGIAASMVKKTLLKNMTPLVQNAVVIAGGVAATFFTDNKFVDGAGAGMMAIGGAGIAPEIIPGLAGFDYAIGYTPRETVYRTIADSSRIVESADEKKNQTETIL